MDYLREAGTYLTEKHGLCNIGQWHSHHRINLFEPSAGDEDTVWSNMPKLGLDRYIVFIANIIGIDNVTIECFLFQTNTSTPRVKHGKIRDLHGNSPLRLNETILQHIHRRAESFNHITIFSEAEKHKRGKGVSKNRDANTDNGMRTDFANYRGRGSSKEAVDRNQGEELVEVKSFELPVSNTSTTLRSPNFGNKLLSDQASRSNHQQFTSHVNQTVFPYPTEPNYTLTKREDESQHVYPNLPCHFHEPDNRQQSGPQRNTFVPPHVNTKKPRSGQTCPHIQAQVITQQPINRRSFYDNLPETNLTPMDVDKIQTTDHGGETTTPDTPSGTIHEKDVPSVDEDDDGMGWSCWCFSKMTISDCTTYPCRNVKASQCS